MAVFALMRGRYGSLFSVEGVAIQEDGGFVERLRVRLRMREHRRLYRQLNSIAVFNMR